MTTDLLAVREDDPVALISSHMMMTGGDPHVPIEDPEHRLLGMVSYRSIVRIVARSRRRADSAPVRAGHHEAPIS